MRYQIGGRWGWFFGFKRFELSDDEVLYRLGFGFGCVYLITEVLHDECES